jgi:hypothetical protein
MDASRKPSWEPLWSEISNKIDRELPGEPLWSQSIPIEGDVAEGLAVRREAGPEGSYWYLLVYFRLVPAEVDPATGEMLGGASADDWDLEVGYRGDFDTLEEAKAEGKEILAALPTPESMRGRGYGFFLDLLRDEDEGAA